MKKKLGLPSKHYPNALSKYLHTFWENLERSMESNHVEHSFRHRNGMRDIHSPTSQFHTHFYLFDASAQIATYM